MASQKLVKSIACCCLLFMLVSVSASYQFNSTPADVAVSSTGQLYVVAGKKLYCLQSTALQHTEMVSPKDTVAVKVTLSSDESTLLVCFRDGTCSIYTMDQENCVSMEYTRISAAVANANVAVVAASGHFYFGISAGIYHPGGNHLILLREFDGHELIRSSDNFAITNSSFVSRKFYHAFQDGYDVYFIVMDTIRDSSNLSSSSAKVLRVCQDYTNDTSFNAMTEVELHCNSFGHGSLIQNGITEIEVFEGAQGMTIVVGFNVGDGHSFCSFDIVDIDMAMEAVFQECADGIHKIPLPWVDYSLITDCSFFNEPMVTECFFGSINSATSVLALASSTPVNGRIVLELNNQINVTASLAVVVDGVSSMYVAVANQSRHAILKFHITEDRTPEMLEAINTLSPVIMLKYGTEQIYAVTETNIFSVALENCSSHMDCASCAMSGDPLCGWCVLEQRCSRRTLCEHAILENRWVTNNQQCIERMGINEGYLEVFSALAVDTYITPSTAMLPTLNQNEHYSCLFTNVETNYSLQLLYNEEREQCVGEEHDVPPFSNHRIDMIFSLLTPSDSVLFETEDTITLYNCSYLRRCRDCQTLPICGWCVYDHMCATSQSLCRQPNDWISQNESLCPAVLPAVKGRYLFPVGAQGNFTLHTRHLPPPITDLQYACRLRYKDSTTTLTDAIYDSLSEDHQIVCLIRNKQVLFSSIPNVIGRERLRLDLVWLNRARVTQFVFNFLRNTDDVQYETGSDGPTQPPQPTSHNDMEVYNCSTPQSLISCSSCLNQNIGTGYDCGWCFNSLSCQSRLDNCYNHLATSSQFCPRPLISSISPTSGHIRGDTTVTITGTDLGVTVDDVESISFGNSPCGIHIQSYIAGTEIACSTTQSNVELNVNVTVEISRPINMIRRAVYHSFRYALPVISSVVPLYGPISGGTRVSIRGSELNISDTTLTRASIAGVECDIREVLEFEIICTTGPGPAVTSEGLITVVVDGHENTFDGGRYTYMRDPVYHSVHPNMIIPAGGVLLTFTGVSLNVSQEPQLQVSIGSLTHTANCTSVSSSSLHCIAPEIPDYTTENVIGQPLDYTIVMDNAPGLSLDSNMDLQLQLRPNPVFTDILESDSVYVGPLDDVTINGMDIDAVDISEITIIFGDIPCNITFQEHNSTHLMFRCSQLDLPPLQVSTFNVIVSIANGTLEYDVGQLTYIPPHNCSKLASSCSSCLALNLNTGFKCGWCNREDHRPDGCSHFDGCLSNYISNVSNVDFCDPPQISSISPTSGHIHGGTIVTITGTDLGVTVDDVVVVLFGDSQCDVQRQRYKPGVEIVCITTESVGHSEGEVLVSVQIRRTNSIESTTNYRGFRYALPVILSVVPLYGPISGGTRVSIRGSELNISDTTLTRASIAGVDCDIRSISSVEITCISQSSDDTRAGVIQLDIDTVVYGQSSLKYTFTPDPQFTAIQPQNTIPAGGVTLTFSGQYLNVTQQPTLNIIIENSILTIICKANGSTTLRCIAPVLLQLGGTNDSFSGSSVLNYTIIMDNAPGPSTDSALLQLRVEPNPVFFEIQDTDREYTGSDDRITILGTDLDAVESSEIGLKMNDKVCNITFIILLPRQIVVECDPPEFSQLPDNLLEVKVLVANGTLVYSVGTLEYIRPSGSGDAFSQWAPLVYALLGVIALLAVIVACAFLIICLVCIMKRSNLLRESISSPQTMELNVSDNGYMTGEENVYDSIPDTLVHNTMELSRELSLPNTFVFPTDDVCIGPPDDTHGPNSKSLSKRRRRGSLPPIPSGNDDYIEMRSHSVSSKDRNEIMSPKRHSINFNEVSVRSQPTFTVHSTTDYVAMLPGTSPGDLDSGHPSTSNTFNFVNYNTVDSRCLRIGVHTHDNNTATTTRDITSESSA